MLPRIMRGGKCAKAGQLNIGKIRNKPRVPSMLAREASASKSLYAALRANSDILWR